MNFNLCFATKKNFLKIIRFFLFATFTTSFAFAERQFYFKGFYNNTYTSGKIEDAKTGKLDVIYITNEKSYNPEYEFSGKVGGAAFGLKVGNNFCIEIENVASGWINVSQNSYNNFFKEVDIDTIKTVKDFLTYNSVSQKKYDELDIEIKDDVKKEMIKLSNDIKDPNHLQKIQAIYTHEKFKYNTTMMNAYYWQTIKIVDLYGGIGAGIARINLDGNSLSSLALQGKIGLTLNVSEYIMPYVGYRLMYILPTSNSGAFSKSTMVIEGMDKTYKTIVDEMIILWGTLRSQVYYGYNSNNEFSVSYLLHNLEVGIQLPFSI